MSGPSHRRDRLRLVVAYWVLLAMTSVFVVSALFVIFLWGPMGLTDAVFAFWRSEMGIVIGPGEAKAYAAQSSRRLVGAFQGLSFASTMPLIVLNLAWMVWGGLVLVRRRP